MKRVEAEIPASLLEGVKERLQLIGLCGMTVVPDGHRCRLEMVTTDERAETAVRAVIAVVRREPGADGRVSVSTIDEAIRISTGEAGAAAL